MQTVALQLGAVNGVTAVLVVGETAGPSLVGVLFLGDTAKAGLGGLAIAGFVGAFVGRCWWPGTARVTQTTSGRHRR